MRVLRQTFDPLTEVAQTPVRALASLLNLSEPRARLVRDPLQLPEFANQVERWRDHVITLLDPGYPPLLAEIHDPPSALWVRGSRDALSRRSVAVVGSRKATHYGLAAATRLARELARHGVVVVSGLARGIDSAAHEAAVTAGGTTIAVMATGIDVIYPRSHEKLAERIVATGGTLITELPPGRPPHKSNFPVRNRIISGLSAGAVIVEASARSGSLITARLAAEQNREVFAVPGSIFHEGTEGPHRLIQYGAKLVHDVSDILEEIGIDVGPELAREAEPDLPEGLATILKTLKPDEPLHVDAIAERSRTPVSRLGTALFELETRGLVKALPGAAYVRIS